MTARRRTAGFVLLGVVGIGGVGGALSGCGNDSSQVSGTNYVAGDGTITIVPAQARQTAVDLRGTTLEGVPVDVAAFRGKVVVLNVWGSWCPPCRKEAPDLQAAYVELRGEGVEFLGINVNERDASQALAFQRSFGITFPSLADDGGAALLALRGAVAPNAIPTTLVLDAEGRIAARISSATTKVTLVDVVEDVLAGRVGT